MNISWLVLIIIVKKKGQFLSLFNNGKRVYTYLRSTFKHKKKEIMLFISITCKAYTHTHTRSNIKTKAKKKHKYSSPNSHCMLRCEVDANKHIFMRMFTNSVNKMIWAFVFENKLLSFIAIFTRHIRAFKKR